MSHFRYCRSYVGPVRACILDWSGTTADKYVLAPAVSFIEVFKKFKVPISMEESREPMGLRKDLHIKAITKMPSVQSRWRKVYGRDPTDKDVDDMFQTFVPIQLDVIRQYGQLIPGTKDSVDELRKDFGCKIGVTTGFLRSMVDILLEEAKKQGYVPDATVAGDEVVNGARPKPFMVYRNLDLLDIHPIQSVVKVDDTISGIGEALEAGCWGVGLARYSNYMNVDSLEQEAELSDEDIQDRLQKTRDILRKAGAHYVVDSIVDLPDVVKDINARLAAGESP
ncbi:phosphonoacetaldehyde hydrolase-like [Haliotis cracherodii]|uniref:phosphonoacetaldehyde hydrolase-like n=1 Tax=Haliotis cracherodii TaxID=6455 RepID=UPI0039EB7565